jgi:hypothetical protein
MYPKVTFIELFSLSLLFFFFFFLTTDINYTLQIPKMYIPLSFTLFFLSSPHPLAFLFPPSLFPEEHKEEQKPDKGQKGSGLDIDKPQKPAKDGWVEIKSKPKVVKPKKGKSKTSTASFSRDEPPKGMGYPYGCEV